MALGLLMGRERMEDTEQYERAVQPAQEICDTFVAVLVHRYEMRDPLTSTLCRDIRQRIFGRTFDVSKPEDRQAFVDLGGRSDQGCPKVCGIGARVAADKILELRGEL